MENKDQAVQLFGSSEVMAFQPDERNSGFENVTQQDIGIPQLIKLEKNSRYLDVDHADYVPVEGAQKGDIILSAGNILYKAGVYVLPFGYARVWTEMKPRSTGGGFVASHRQAPANTRTDQDGRVTTSTGNEIKETAVWGILVKLPDDSWTPAVVRMQGASLGSSRQWLNFSKVTGRPLYGDVYTLSTEGTKNEKGSFLLWKFKHAGSVSAAATDLVSKARELCASFNQMYLASPAATTEVVDNPY